MRIVKWNPQQRVDVPDMAAASFLVLGEFRRAARDVVLGEGENYILRGFAVEPAAVPDATVRVRLDLGGGDTSAALGSENVGTGTVFGQLVGGEDDDGNLEGNAQQVLNFGAEAPGTFTVQMRFVYTDGVTDNRAFWNETLKAEEVQSAETRHLPGFELRLSGAPSPEWIDLAEVVWNGATIDAADITDLRTFAIEGAAPFQQATQATAGGAPDFDRTATREDPTIGLNAVLPALRALARQVRDIKGQNAAGTWDWFSRPFAPADPTAALPAPTTKTLRSVETVTYTVGDDTTTFGDFNGVLGLDACLAHVHAMGASRPRSISIRIKSNATGAFALTLPTSYNFAQEVHLDIEALCDTSIAVTAATVPIIVSFVSSVLQSKIRLVNLRFTTPTNNVSILAAGAAVEIERCTMPGHTAAGASSEPVISAWGTSVMIRDSAFTGRVKINPNDGTPGPSVGALVPRLGTLIERCTIDGAIDCREVSSDYVNGAVIRDCAITQTQTHGWGLRAAIDLAGAANVLVDRCFITHNPDTDGINARRIAVGPFRHTYRNCTTETTGAGAHAVDGGAGGAAGTGWGIAFGGAGADFAGNLVVDGCSLGGAASIDAGGLRIYQTGHFDVTGCRIAGSHAGGGSNRFTAIRIDGNAPNTQQTGAIRGCSTSFGNSAGERERTRALHITNAQKVRIEGCDFDGGSFGVGFTGRTVAGVEIGECSHITFDSCVFSRWEPDTTTSACLTNTGEAQNIHVTGCSFVDNGGWPLRVWVAANTRAWVIANNTVITQHATGNGILVGAFVIHCSVTGNNVRLAGTSRDGIDFSAAVDHICTGNRLHNATINVVSGVVWGVSVPGGGGPTNLNFLT